MNCKAVSINTGKKCKKSGVIHGLCVVHWNYEVRKKDKKVK